MPSADGIEDRLRVVTGQNDDYLQTVWALCAFAHAVCFDDANRSRRLGTHVCVPRKMDAVAGGDRLTPDAVVQWMPGKGIVVEAKKHITDDTASECFDQAKKYDQALVGWWTPDHLIPTHDVVMLTHLFSSAKAKDAYELWKQNGGRFDRRFAIVQFTRTTTGIQVTHLAKVAGEVSDPDLNQTLHEGIKFPERVAATLFANHKLMDSKPPIELMIELLLTHVLPALGQPDPDDDSGTFGTEFDVTVESVRRKSEEIFRDPEWHLDDRGFRLPRKDWVRAALDGLAKMGLASVTDQDSYRIKLRKPRRGDLMRFIVTQLLKGAKKANGTVDGQLPLAGLEGPEADAQQQG